MRIQHGLYLSDVSVIFCDADQMGVTSVFSYALSDADYLEKLEAFLRQRQPGAFNVYLDLMGEEYKQESIPHISGRDRDALLDRKSKSLFPSADLVWKKHLRREKTGRKDDVYLLVGLSLPSSVDHIFDALVQAKYQIAGVYSLSILEQQIHANLELSEQSLLVSRVLGSPEGKRIYRQTFFKGGHLAMSRVTSINGETDEQVFSQLMTEIERMRHFLAGTRQLNTANKLVVRSAFSEEEASRFLRYEVNNERLKIENIQLSSLAKKVGLGRTKVFSSLAELLIVGASQKLISTHFKPKGLTNVFNVLKTKRMMRAVTFVLLLVSTCVAGFVAYTAKVKNDQLQVLSFRVQGLEQQRAQLLDNVQETEVSATKMKQLVELSHDISTYQFGPDKVLEVIARAYRGFKYISIEDIKWIDKPLNQQGNNRRHRGYSEPFIMKLKAARQFELKVALPSSLGNREILENIERFLNALRELPEVTDVRRKQAALNTSENAEMAASLGSASSLSKPVEFTLSITMEL